MTQTQTGFGHGNCQYCGASMRGGHTCTHMPTTADPADLGDAAQTGKLPNEFDDCPRLVALLRDDMDHTAIQAIADAYSNGVTDGEEDGLQELHGVDLSDIEDYVPDPTTGRPRDFSGMDEATVHAITTAYRYGEQDGKAGIIRDGLDPSDGDGADGDEAEHPSRHLVPAPYAGPFGEDYTIMPGGGGFSFDPDDTGYVTTDQMWDAFNDHWPTHDFGPRQEREMEALDEADEGTLVTGSAYGRARIVERGRKNHPFSVYTDDTQSGVIGEIRTDTDNEADDCAHDFVNAVEYADWDVRQEAADEEERERQDWLRREAEESQYIAGQEW